jgi:hypothetical protein
VRGERGSMRPPDAEASAEIRVAGGATRTVPFRLHLQDGCWKVSALPQR